MPKGKKFGGRDWVKGQSGNPKGSKPIPEDVKEARRLSQIEFDRACGKIFFMSVEELTLLVNNKKQTNVLEALVGKILLKGINESSKSELNYFIERFLGKVAEQHNFSGNLNTGLVDLIEKMKKAREVGPIGIEESSKKEDW